MEGVLSEDFRVYSSSDTKCPSCGGKLVFEPVEQMLKCGFCGNTYTPEKAVAEEKPEEPVRGTSFDDFDEFGNLK